MKIYEEDELMLIMVYRRAKQKVGRTRTVESFLVRVPKAGRVGIYDIQPTCTNEKLTQTNGSK